MAGVFRVALHDPVLLAPAHARRGAIAQRSGIPCQSPRAVPGHQPARGGGPDRRQEDTAVLLTFHGGRGAWPCGVGRPGSTIGLSTELGALDGGRAAGGGQRATFCPGRTLVDREHLYAGLSAYLLAGIFFGVFYWVLERTWSGSFAVPGEGAPGQFFTYRCRCTTLLTLATMGYGDIVPRSQAARGVTIMEAIAGQLYLAVTIARLVSLYVSREDKGERP